MLAKPPNIANDEFKSAKWDELTAGRNFTTSDAPALALLCQWHKLAQQAMDEPQARDRAAHDDCGWQPNFRSNSVECTIGSGTAE